MASLLSQTSPMFQKNLRSPLAQLLRHGEEILRDPRRQRRWPKGFSFCCLCSCSFGYYIDLTFYCSLLVFSSSSNVPYRSVEGQWTTDAADFKSHWALKACLVGILVLWSNLISVEVFRSFVIVRYASNIYFATETRVISYMADKCINVKVKGRDLMDQRLSVAANTYS